MVLKEQLFKPVVKLIYILKIILFRIIINKIKILLKNNTFILKKTIF